LIRKFTQAAALLIGKSVRCKPTQQGERGKFFCQFL